jgi:uncharacterized damage-inducible protein DinB
MRPIVRLGTLIALTLTLALPVGAQTREGVMGDLIRDVEQVQKKFVGLAQAMPAEAFEWRPGEGVRSTSETFRHVAADNYFMPAVLGTSAPAGTGITKEYKTAAAFEKRPMARDEVIAELEKSFAFLKQSMTSFPDAKMDAPIDVFGQKMTNRGLWVAATTHLHEHLGQLIAYARSNKITPPWSK